MYYVYLIQSINHLNEYYIGLTKDLINRINAHNSGRSTHTNKFKPWALIAYFAFKKLDTAKNFETYLKTGSGRAFLKKHFLS